MVMAIKVENQSGFRPLYDGVITADVYVGLASEGTLRKIASPGDAVEVGSVQRGRQTLCRLNREMYWVENSAWGVDWGVE
jgi:hypothetical protein